ncbi:kunitz-type serine protease inhibitor 3-like [Pomacea canaliculata]|uniref:kunitz-type serine protease inhibitor 3-like n=1 Tax=Pomacea canaliculata TaxID=400727 RepID=UPI000D733346|nr:kunitz-type serine protease inhibitor 3-like [Pomacea canaliculata]
MVKRKCEQSYYGCCPNSSQAATGPNNQGCPGTATTTAFDPAVCGGDADLGDCSDYTVQWYYDKPTASCRRFWYGGCGGNGNRFSTKNIACWDASTSLAQPCVVCPVCPGLASPPSNATSSTTRQENARSSLMGDARATQTAF